MSGLARIIGNALFPTPHPSSSTTLWFGESTSGGGSAVGSKGGVCAFGSARIAGVMSSANSRRR